MANFGFEECAGIASSHSSDHRLGTDGQTNETKGEGASAPSPSFDIPELPSGQTLLFELLSSWGDASLIGLRSVQIFTAEGKIPSMVYIQSNASQIISGTLRSLFRMPNIGGERGEGNEEEEGEEEEEEEEHGERGTDDGTTEGDNGDGNGEMWLCKYSDEKQQRNRRLSSSPIQIVVHFPAPLTLAMIRILNYFCPANVRFARRGVRSVRIWLDNQCIFCGEICCALSGGADSSTIGDTILFTTNEQILARIAENDEAMAPSNGDGEEEEERRSTGQSERDGGQMGTEQREQCHCVGVTSAKEGAAALSRLASSTRPTTGNCSVSPSPSPPCEKCKRLKDTEEEAGDAAEASNAVTESGEGQAMERREKGEEEGTENAIVGRVFHMELLANWGCPDAIGLTGIQFLGPQFEPIGDHLAKECVVRCEPKGNGCSKEDGELANLFNGTNLTCETDEMWLSSVWNAQGPAPMLSFTFPHEIRICGVSVWNYNGSLELSYAGVRYVRFYANGKPLPVGMVLLRKAPGFLFFDFVQDVLFDRCPLVVRPLLSGSRPLTRSIAAFIFQIRLLSSWGDEFYIGLNGLELFNGHDMPIQLHPQNLAAFPESVNCLATVCGDPRSSDKLIDGVNDTAKAHHMWLTPILPNSCARVFIIFDAPTVVTRIRIYNYRKTPDRGVRHIALSADDLLLCSGAEVPISSPEKTGILDVSLRDGEFP